MAKENKINVIWETLPLEILVPDPDVAPIIGDDGEMEIADYVLVKLVYDFTDGIPPYGPTNDWWYYDKKTDTVHVMIAEDVRQRYGALYKKKQSSIELSKDEANELETLAIVIEDMPNEAIWRYLQSDLFERVLLKDDHKKGNRTINKAGDVVSMPEKYAIITQADYKNALGLSQVGRAYLMTADGLTNKDGKLYFNSIPASKADIKVYSTNKVPENLDMPLLRAFYSIILNEIWDNINNHMEQTPVITVYLPHLFKYLGKDKPSRNQTLSIINGIMSFNDIVGVIDEDILPVLVFLGENQEKNTISFSSPYMNRVIEKVHKICIKKDKNGKMQSLPSHSYLIKPSIVNERNKKAVEIVNIVVTTIEQCGNHEAHLAARTIVERNVLLDNSMKMSGTTSKNTMLRRAFGKAWELLETQTYLKDVYKDIELPKPEAQNIPTVSTLNNMVFYFRHKGKK